MTSFSPTLEYTQLMSAFRSRKFTRNDIKSFVYRIFSMYERATCDNEYLGAEAFDDLVADDVHVDFPDYRIRSREEFKEWHRWIHGLLNSDDHQIDRIAVEYLADGRYQARFFVRWRADFKDGRYIDLQVEQLWIMREEADLPLPVIERYVVGLSDALNAETAGQAIPEDRNRS